MEQHSFWAFYGLLKKGTKTTLQIHESLFLVSGGFSHSHARKRVWGMYYMGPQMSLKARLSVSLPVRSSVYFPVFKSLSAMKFFTSFCILFSCSCFLSCLIFLLSVIDWLTVVFPFGCLPFTPLLLVKGKAKRQIFFYKVIITAAAKPICFLSFFSRKQGRIHGTRYAKYAYFSLTKITRDGHTDRRTDGHDLL